MKKYLIPMMMVLMVLSSAFVMAEVEVIDEVVAGDVVTEVTIESPSSEVDARSTNPRMSLKVVTHLMENYGLDETNSIGDLLDALQSDIDDKKDALMDEFGVSTNEELKEAIKEQKIENIRDTLGLDASLSDEEVIEAAKEQRMDLVKDLLGLDETASEEEVAIALEEWRNENSLLFPKIRARLGFFNNLFN